MTIAVSGRQFEISAGTLRATITEAGAGLREFDDEGSPLLDTYGADELCPGAHGQLLIPWPNRVDRGRYTFDGHEHQLDITEPAGDHAIHGLARWVPWQLHGHQPNQVTLTHRLHGHPGYPFVLDLSASYVLHPDAGLTVAVTATNVGTTPAPYGSGAHPYLTVGTATIDECLLTVPASTRLPIDDRDLPSGQEAVLDTPYDFRQPRPIGEVWLNHAYTDLDRDADGNAWTWLEAPDGSAAVGLWVDDTYPWLQLFTGDALDRPGLRRTGLAVEPMSCPPNAFVTGEDVLILDPGATHTARWGITAMRR